VKLELTSSVSRLFWACGVKVVRVFDNGTDPAKSYMQELLIKKSFWEKFICFDWLKNNEGFV